MIPDQGLGFSVWREGRKRSAHTAHAPVARENHERDPRASTNYIKGERGNAPADQCRLTQPEGIHDCFEVVCVELRSVAFWCHRHAAATMTADIIANLYTPRAQSGIIPTIRTEGAHDVQVLQQLGRSAEHIKYSRAQCESVQEDGVRLGRVACRFSIDLLSVGRAHDLDIGRRKRTR